MHRVGSQHVPLGDLKTCLARARVANGDSSRGAGAGWMRTHWTGRLTSASRTHGRPAWSRCGRCCQSATSLSPVVLRRLQSGRQVQQINSADVQDGWTSAATPSSSMRSRPASVMTLCWSSHRSSSSRPTVRRPELQSTYQLIQIHPVRYVDLGFRGTHQARTTRGTMRRFETQSVPTLSFYFC